MTLENLFKIGLIIMFTAVWLAAVRWVWTHQLDPIATVQRLIQRPFKAPDWVATREPNKIYQNGNVVGEVTGPVKEEGSTVRFTQLANTTSLNQAVVFQYQRHNLRIRQVGSVVSHLMWKNEMAHSSGEIHNHQSAAGRGGHRRNAPWESIPGNGKRCRRARAARSGS